MESTKAGVEEEDATHDRAVEGEDDDDSGTDTTIIATLAPETFQAEVLPQLESPNLEVGDHVYQWRSLLGVPFMFQHHGIVMDVEETRITIADFSNVELRAKASKPSPEKRLSKRLSLEQEGVVRTYTDTDKWHKVKYESGFWKRQVSRSGTATHVKADPVGLVLARVNFILRHPEKLPDYHVLHANCECVAFWCKTGSWSTLQGSSFLELTAAGQVKSSATLAATAASTTATVTVPAAGIWGSWFGATTTTSVSWLSLHPMAIPGLACYAAIMVGVPTMMYAKARQKWKETSEYLSNSFWEAAIEHPEVFAECLTHWSDKG